MTNKAFGLNFNPRAMEQKDRLEILKDILFTDDREYTEKIAQRIEILEQTINERKKLSQKVDPIIAGQLEQFTEEIPTTLGPVITETLREEIGRNREEVVDALYPIIGKMIKKYVAQEIKLLSDKVNKQMSTKRFRRKIRSWFGGVNENELALSELSMAQIQQVFLIEKSSGILRAGYVRSKTIDEELISGMLTAIKSFVEDAFGEEDQDLEQIEYEHYTIHLQSFVTYYIAVVISGNYSLSAKNKVQDIIFDFYHRFMAMNLDLVFTTKNGTRKVEPIDRKWLERRLAKHFGNADL